MAESRQTTTQDSAPSNTENRQSYTLASRGSPHRHDAKKKVDVRDPVRCLLNHDHGNEEAPKYVNKLQQLVRRGAASKTPVQCTASRPSTASQPVLMRAFRPPPVPKRPRSRPAVTPNIHRPGYTGDLHQPTPHANNDILEITRDDDSDSCISDGERRSYEFEIRRLQRELRAETTRANALQKQTASLLDELKMQGRFETLQSKVYIGE